MRAVTSFCWISLLGAVLAGGGCSSFSYDIAAPADHLKVHTTSDRDASLKLPPLEYTFHTIENRMVMLIYNPTQSPIELLGDRSTIVDPLGVSHPLHRQTIAPESSIREIFPPFRSDSSGSFGSPPPGGAFGANDQPGYLLPPDVGAMGNNSEAADDYYHWEWDDESTVRLTLAFEEGKEIFTQQFDLSRVKQ